MKTSTIALAVLAVGGLSLAAQSFLSPDPVTEPAPIPAALAEQPVELLSAQAFTLEQPATHWYRAEQPSYTSGLLLVLHADEDLVRPRQSAEPVLYVGAETAERVNHGTDSGNLVVIVPNLTLAELADAPIFFGAPELPERVTAADAARELEFALAGGAHAPALTRIETVTGEALLVFDDTDLRARAADSIESFSPSEVDVVNGLRAMRLR